MMNALRAPLPPVALSVRQPWAWAIFGADKDIENRLTTSPAVNGFTGPRQIAIHAAKGMTREEYNDARDHMITIGVDCPRPNELVRGAIIGAVTVTAIVSHSDSRWFFGPRGLVLADPILIAPIPCVGALGYFSWMAAGELEMPLPWMMAWPKSRQPTPLPLFGGGA